MVALALPDPEAGRRHVTVIEPMIGGGGGRPGQDGIDGCDASLGFLKTTPAETLETEVPIVVRRFHLVPDSAGPGRLPRRLRRAAGLPGLPPRGAGDRARDGAAALRAVGRGRRHRRRDRQRGAEPGHRRRARAAEDRRAGARARRRAERADAGRRRPRRPLRAAAGRRCSPTSRRASSRASTRARPTAWSSPASASTRRRPPRCGPPGATSRPHADVRLRTGAPRARAALAAGRCRMRSSSCS